MGEFWERWEVEETLTRGISIVRELWELRESFFMCLESFGMCLESSWKLNPSYFYVSGRFWEAQFVVFYVSGRLWEAQSVVFYTLRAGPPTQLSLVRVSF